MQSFGLLWFAGKSCRGKPIARITLIRNTRPLPGSCSNVGFVASTWEPRGHREFRDYRMNKEGSSTDTVPTCDFSSIAALASARRQEKAHRMRDQKPHTTTHLSDLHAGRQARRRAESPGTSSTTTKTTQHLPQLWRRQGHSATACAPRIIKWSPSRCSTRGAESQTGASP